MYQALVEELEKRLHEAHTKGLEEAEAVETQEESGAEPGSEGSLEKPSMATGGGETGTVSEKVTAQSGGGEEKHYSGAEEDTVAGDKENRSPLNPPVVTPASEWRYAFRAQVTMYM